MLLKNTQTGETFPFTFEAVGACDLETLAFAISEIQKHNLPATRIVTIVGLDELMAKGWIRPMLEMARDAGIRLIVPPISPLQLKSGESQEQRWNAGTPEGAWLGTFWDDETLERCCEVLGEFLGEYEYDFPLDDCFGVLITDTGFLDDVSLVELFTKVSVLCGTSNASKADLLVGNGANSINLVPMSPSQVKEISRYVGGAEECLLDVYIDPPRSICPPWYELDTVIALAPEYIEAGAGVLKAEGTEIVGQLLDHDYLMKIAISRQILVFQEVLEVLTTAPYEVVEE